MHFPKIKLKLSSLYGNQDYKSIQAVSTLINKSSQYLLLRTDQLCISKLHENVYKMYEVPPEK